MSVSDCRIFDLPRIQDPRGNLTFAEGNRHVPFEIKRVYYLYDVPAGAERGGHAHRRLHQVMVAVSGSFRVRLDDGTERRTVLLNRPYTALHIVPGIWRELEDFSSGSVCLVLASERYDEGDYWRDYHAFLDAVRR